MAKSDLYHKINIEYIIKGLERAPRQSFSSEKFQFSPGGVLLCPEPKLTALDKFKQSFSEQGLELPPDYLAFLNFSNGANIYGQIILPIGDQEHRPFFFLDGADRDRKNEHAYSIAHDGCGNDTLINLKAPRGAKNPNRRDLLDTFHETDETVVIAKSFGEFLYRLLEGGKIYDSRAEDRSQYWLWPEFMPYREYYGVEFNDRHMSSLGDLTSHPDSL